MMKPFLIAVTLIILLLGSGCTSNKTKKEDNVGHKTAHPKDQISIGYDSLPVFLGTAKSEVEKIIDLKLDTDNPYAKEIGYYSQLDVVGFNKLKGDVYLYFRFKKTDSTLVSFTAGVVFKNCYRDKIMSNLKEELGKKLDKMIEFSPESIGTKDGVTKLFKDYKINIRLDSVFYSPTFYYSIYLLK